MKTKPKVELLAPAGNFEKLEIAVFYGADAVYLGGKDFSLRNFSGNFSDRRLKEAVKYAHSRNVKVYVACNAYPRSSEISSLGQFLDLLAEISPDAIIVADPGVFSMARTRAPNVDVHLSTQANTTNPESALFWQNLGVKRINAARELSLAEIEEISNRVEIEIEAFVHGAMCISYSGRCLLSSFMALRDGNRGMCCHPCRWKYSVVEETRPGQYFPVAEDERGTYVFNSRDLCMVDRIPEMIRAGIDSLKIEGRMKGINYLATTVKVYREAVDDFLSNPEGFQARAEWASELGKVGLRDYCTGFYLGDPSQTVPCYTVDKHANQQFFVGRIIEKTREGKARIELRNKLYKGEEIEILPQKGPPRNGVVREMEDLEGCKLDYAQPGSVVAATLSAESFANELLRRTRPFVRQTTTRNPC